MIQALPEALRTQLPARSTVRARINALARLDTNEIINPVDRLRLDLIGHRVTMLREVLAQDKTAEAELAQLVQQIGATLPGIPGIATRAAAEMLLEVGDVRRFTEAGFARFNGTAPLPASSGEGGGSLVRHRLNRGDNRRLNAAIHRAAMIQLRCEPRARELRDQALNSGHTRREAMRILKRHLSNVIYRTMLRDARHQSRPGGCQSAPPATGVKAGRRPPAGLGLDPGEDGAIVSRPGVGQPAGQSSAR